MATDARLLRELPDLGDPAFRRERVARFRAQLERAYARSRFFRGRLEALGIRPSAVTTWEDFRAIPALVTKDDERREEQRSRERDGHTYGDLLLVDPRDVVAVSSTSGTSGVPTFTYLYTRRDLETTTELWRRAMTWIGAVPGDRILNAFGMSMGVPGPPAVASLWAGGYQCIPIGAEAGTARILRMAELTRPKVLMGTPSLVEHLAERATEVIDKPVGDLGIEVLLVAGEPGAGLPEYREKMTTLYGARLYDAQFGVFGAVNISCEGVEYHGLHELAPDLHVRSEDLRDLATGAPVELADGARGEYLYTALVHEARPTLKWRPGDIAEVFVEPCRCGFRGIRYRLLGRVDDMLIVKGVNVFPSAIKGVVERFFPRTTGHFRIVLEAPPPRVAPPLRLRVECGEGTPPTEYAALADTLGAVMHAELKIRPAIEVLPAGTLPRSDQKSTLLEYEETTAR